MNTLDEMDATASITDADVTSPIGESSLSSVFMIIEPDDGNTCCVCCIGGEGSFKAVMISLVTSDAADM